MIRLVSVIVVSMISLVGCDSRNRQESQIKIGAILPLTGKYADAGNAIRVGLELAKQDIAAQKSQDKFEVLYFDTKSEAKNALFGYNKLSTLNGVNFFFTTISENGMVIKPALLKGNGMLFGILSHVDLLKNRDGRVFRLLQTGSDEADFISDYILGTLKANKILLYVFNAEAGKAFQHTFKLRLGDKITKIEEFGEDVGVLKSMVTSSRINESDCIVVIGYSSAMGNIIKFVRQAGYTKDIVANIGFNTPSVLAAAGEAGKTVWFDDYDLPYGTEEHNEMTKRASSKFNTPFTSLSYIAYGALNLLDQCESYEGGDQLTLLRGALNFDGDIVAGKVRFHVSKDGKIITGLKMRKSVR